MRARRPRSQGRRGLGARASRPLVTGWNAHPATVFSPNYWMRPFKPEHAGKMGFYLATVDDLLRHPQDNPSIGLILCKSHNRIIAEYALSDSIKPIGIADYLAKIAESLPENLAASMPTIEQLEAELARDIECIGSNASDNHSEPA